MESSCSLVVIGTFLNVVRLHFLRRYVAVVDVYSVSLLLVVDVVIIEECKRLNLGSIVEDLIAIETVFVGIYLSAHHQLEEIGKEVHLRPHRLHRIIESGIGIVGKVNGAVDVTSPHHILLHRCRCRI